MNSTDTVNKPTVTKTLAEYAEAYLVAHATATQIETEIEPAIKALNLLPKTPTGKTTKAVKQAEEILLKRRSLQSHVIAAAEKRFDEALLKAVMAFNTMHSAPAVVEISMNKHGFYYDSLLTEAMHETTKRVTEADASDVLARARGGKYAMYSRNVFVNELDRVYTKDLAGGRVYIVVYHRNHKSGNTSYGFKYVGPGPVDGPLGSYLDDDNAFVSHFNFDSESPLGNGRVNHSAIGSEYVDDSILRLEATIEYMKLAKALSYSNPFVSATHNASYLYNDAIVEQANAGNALLVVRYIAQHNEFWSRDKHDYTTLMTEAEFAALKPEQKGVKVGVISTKESYSVSVSEESDI